MTASRSASPTGEPGAPYPGRTFDQGDSGLRKCPCLLDWHDGLNRMKRVRRPWRRIARLVMHPMHAAQQEMTMCRTVFGRTAAGGRLGLALDYREFFAASDSFLYCS